MLKPLWMTRRKLLLGASLALALPAHWPAWADEAGGEWERSEGDLPPLPDDLAGAERAGSFQDYDQALSDLAARGSATPTSEEESTALDIVACAPYGIEPYQVAQYFYDVGQGKYEAAWKPYAREWPVRANPVIVEFFRATKTKPAGDTTPWCAAFVNWCIARGNSSNGVIGDSELKLTSQSALSGSFRCWDKGEPKVGDIAVFAQSGTSGEGCSGKGHVGFFIGKTADGSLRVLGGNQGLAGTNGAVTISQRRKSSERDEDRWVGFYGFRTSPALHKVAAASTPAPVPAPTAPPATP